MAQGAIKKSKAGAPKVSGQILRYQLFFHRLIYISQDAAQANRQPRDQAQEDAADQAAADEEGISIRISHEPLALGSTFECLRADFVHRSTPLASQR